MAVAAGTVMGSGAPSLPNDWQVMRVILSARTAERLEEALGSPLPPDVIVVPDPVDIEIYPETLERCERAAR